MPVPSPPLRHEVKDARSFAAWTQASFGCPPPTLNDIKILNKKAREFFDLYPAADWQTMVRIADWCASKKRRMARVWRYVDQYRFAWADHAIDLKPDPGGIDRKIAAALQQETDPLWRSRLRRAAGAYREEVLDEWVTHRGSTT